MFFPRGTATVEWEETQATLDQEMDSYQFSSPEVVIAATSMNKCDAAVQEISRNNKKEVKEPVKNYTRAQQNIKRNAMQKSANRAENEEGKQDGYSDVEAVERGSGKILICQNGRLSTRQEAIKKSTKCSSNARLTKRMQAKQKCFGKQLTTERKLNKTISSIDDQNRAQVDHSMKQKFDNLEFGVEDGDTNVTTADDLNIEEKSFTRLRSRDSGACVPEKVTSYKEPSHEGTLKLVKSAPKTRAQKRNFQGTLLRSSCESIPQNKPNVLCDIAGETMSNEQEKMKIIKTSQETPVKPQG